MQILLKKLIKWFLSFFHRNSTNLKELKKLKINRIENLISENNLTITKHQHQHYYIVSKGSLYLFCYGDSDYSLEVVEIYLKYFHLVVEFLEHCESYEHREFNNFDIRCFNLGVQYSNVKYVSKLNIGKELPNCIDIFIRL